MLGYAGKILRVNLSTGKITAEKLDEKQPKNTLAASVSE